jgi:hypothetical protein
MDLWLILGIGRVSDNSMGGAVTCGGSFAGSREDQKAGMKAFYESIWREMEPLIEQMMVSSE